MSDDDHIVSFPELGVEVERTFQGFWKFRHNSVKCELHPDETGELWKICLVLYRRESSCRTAGELRDAVEFALEKAEQLKHDEEKDRANERARARFEQAERDRREREGQLPAREICVDGVILREIDPHIDSLRDIWEFYIGFDERRYWFQARRDRGEKEWAVRLIGEDDHKYEWGDVFEDELDERPRDFREIVHFSRIHARELIEDEAARERGEYSPEDALLSEGDPDLEDDDNDVEDQLVLDDEAKPSDEDLYNRAKLEEWE